MPNNKYYSNAMLTVVICGGIFFVWLGFFAMNNGNTWIIPSRGGRSTESSPWHGVVMGCGFIAFGIYGIRKSTQPAPAPAPAPEPEPPLPQNLEVKAESRLTRWLANGFAVSPTLMMLAYGVQDLNRPASERQGNFVMILTGSIAVYGACFLLGFWICKAIERSVGLHRFVRWFILLCASAPALGVVGIGISDLIAGKGDRAGFFLMIFGLGPVVFLIVFVPLLLVCKAIQRSLRRG